MGYDVVPTQKVRLPLRTALYIPLASKPSSLIPSEIVSASSETTKRTKTPSGISSANILFPASVPYKTSSLPSSTAIILSTPSMITVLVTIFLPSSTVLEVSISIPSAFCTTISAMLSTFRIPLFSILLADVGIVQETTTLSSSEAPENVLRFSTTLPSRTKSGILVRTT